MAKASSTSIPKYLTVLSARGRRGCRPLAHSGSSWLSCTTYGICTGKCSFRLRYNPRHERAGRHDVVHQSCRLPRIEASCLDVATGTRLRAGVAVTQQCSATLLTRHHLTLARTSARRRAPRGNPAIVSAVAQHPVRRLLPVQIEEFGIDRIGFPRRDDTALPL